MYAVIAISSLRAVLKVAILFCQGTQDSYLTVAGGTQDSYPVRNAVAIWVPG